MNTMNASTQELAFAPISAVAESIRKKELSPVDLVRASLGRIEALDSKLNSFYTLFRDEVMSAARAAEAEVARGQYRGPLHGIPIGIKDIYECGPTTCGSKALKDYVAAEDCTAVRKRLEQRVGIISLGRTGLCEHGLVHGRLDSMACAVLRNRRAEGNLWAGEPGGGLSAGVEPRPYRTASAHG
jgi:amidase